MRLVILTLLIAALVMGSSFKPENDAQSKGAFNATLDGKMFQLSAEQLFKGLVASKAGSMDGKTPARNIITATFNGSSFTEKIQFEIDYANLKAGAAGNYSVSLLHESFDYAIIKEQSKMNITGISWEEDKKHFYLSADFDCKMRSAGYPDDKLRDIGLKGKLSSIRITVPASLAPKN